MTATRPALVTGAGGFIGGHLCRLLADSSEPLVGVLAPGEPPPSLDDACCTHSFTEADLRDAEAVRILLAEHQPERIFNLAAVGVALHPTWSVDDLIQANVQLPGILYECMADDCRLVHTGSMSEFIGDAHPLQEDTAKRSFRTLYGWSKLAADSLLETLCTAKEKWCIRARLFGVIGSGEAPHRLLPSIVSGCLAGQEVPLSDGKQIRDVLHVQDVVSALVFLSRLPSSSAGRSINVGRGEGQTVRRMAELAGERLACAGLLRFGEIPRRPGESDVMVADISRLRETGWTPRLTFEESVLRTVDALAGAANSGDRS